MGRYLIIANQTLGGERLDRTVQERLTRGDSEFHILVPMTAPIHESTVWSGGFDPYAGMTTAQIEEARRAMEAYEHAQRKLAAEARGRAEQRLRQMIERIESSGAAATGTVGDPDPVVAVEKLLASESFDEIIVSTLPTRISRWLRMDLPSRVTRLTDTPVLTIEAADPTTGRGDAETPPEDAERGS